jgi:hypothetical protein
VGLAKVGAGGTVGCGLSRWSVVFWSQRCAPG